MTPRRSKRPSGDRGSDGKRAAPGQGKAAARNRAGVGSPSAAPAYELLEKLGEGWAGEVFRARLDAPLLGQAAGTMVVFKAYKPAIFAADPNVRQRIEREGELMTSIRHGNVVRAFGFQRLTIAGEERDCLMLELCEGGTLSSRIQRRPRLDGTALLRLARELASALASLHEAGIVHRDVKPQNILLAGNGAAKLGDFGVARRVHDFTMTQSADFLGTIRYAAPEVLDGERESPASDVYSLGTVLYELLYSRPPLSKQKRFSAIISKLASSGLDWPSAADRFGLAVTYEHCLLETVARAMTIRKPKERPSMPKVLEWLDDDGIAAPVRDVALETLVELLREHRGELQRRAGNKVWISAGYNAARTLEAMSRDDVVSVLSGVGLATITEAPSLFSIATARLPIAEYPTLPPERRAELVRSLGEDYLYWIGLVPYDEIAAIENQKAQYGAVVQKLIEGETDRDLLASLRRMIPAMRSEWD